VPATGLLAAALGRPLRDLRISVTDRCNFRCSYCMPKEVFDKDYPFLPHASLLSFEEITRAGAPVRRARRAQNPPDRRRAAVAQEHRSAGGQLAALRTVDGAPLDITLTTNGSLLARKARP
jgi:cyclic pyranopterin phosphate synthase